MTSLFHKPKAPATPNYADLATQQGAANKDAALTTAKLGSPNETNPFGSITRQYDANTGQFNYNTTLSPDQEKLFEGGQDIDLAKMDLGKTQIGNISDLWSQPFDTSGMTNRVTNIGVPALASAMKDYSMDPGAAPSFQKSLDLSGLGARPNSVDFSGLPQIPGANDFSADRKRVEDTLYNDQTSRLDPQWHQQEQQLRDQLYSQGIREGNPAWTQAFDQLNRSKNDAYNQARNSSITGAGAEQSRMFDMASSARSQAANEIMQKAGFQLDSRAQGVQEALTSGNFANAVQQLQAAYGMDRQSAINAATQMHNAMEQTVGTTNFDQQMQNAVLANNSRGQEMDEAAFLRELPFNEFQAMTNGTNVTQPSFNGPTVAPSVSPTPAYQAGQDAYTAAYNNYAQQMASLNQMWSTIGQIGGAVGGGLAGGP